MSHTACEYVFQAVYIDRQGDVYSCAHQFPAARPYGNLRADSLAEILRTSSELARAQAASRDGQLACFSGCNLLPYAAKHRAVPLPIATTVPARIRKLKLTIGWLCNATCEMCPQDHRERTQLDLATLRDRIDWSSVDEIIVEGGEPLAIRLTYELWDHLAALGKRVNFLTNALLVTPAIARRLADSSDYLYISVNAVTATTYHEVMGVDRWQRLLESLQLLREAKATTNSPLRLIAHFTITGTNLAEVARFVPWAEAQGFDVVNFGYNRMPTMGPVVPLVLHDAPRVSQQLRDELRATLAAASARGRIRVDPSRLLYLGLLRDTDDVVDPRLFEYTGN